jgi:hypothetical protein
VTDEQQAELRRGFEALVRAASAGWKVSATVTVSDTDNAPESMTGFEVKASRKRPGPWAASPLTTEKQLALSVLLGDRDAATTAAMIDAMTEAGYLDEGAVEAIAERARAEERERVCRYLDEQAELLRRSGYHLQADATRDHAAWIRADRYAETPVRAVTDG